MGKTFRSWFNHATLKWLNKRIPPAPSITLNLKNIFILPSKLGWAFLILCLCIFVLGINYQNNLLLFLAEFILSLVLVVLVMSYRNLAGLTITAEDVKPVHAKSNSFLTLKMCSGKKEKTKQYRSHGVIEGYWKDTLPRYTLDMDKSCQLLHLPVATSRRGRFRLDRVTLACEYPLGLFRCWTHLDFDQTVLVYPYPIASLVNLSHLSDEQGERSTEHLGYDDFYALRSWQKTDALNKVAWKRVARGGDWAVKEFSEQQSQSGYLELSRETGDTETGLSKLTWQVLSLTEQNIKFGLVLDTTVIPPQIGNEHQSACLEALALYRFGVPQ